MEEFVVLVNEKDEELGIMEKQQAHVKGVLHRAFSVLIYNSKGEMLIHQRAKSKYHSPLLWTNACCSHPRKGETYKEAAHRRLKEELGFDCELKEEFNFIYKAKLNDLYEHELDYVFTGVYDGEINFNKDEVNACKWISVRELANEIEQNSEEYTVWFKIIWEKYLTQIGEK